MKMSDLFKSKKGKSINSVVDLNRFNPSNRREFYENRELIAAELEKFCQPWLKATTGGTKLSAYLENPIKTFYSGTNFDPNRWVKPIRGDRIPGFIPQPIHDILVDLYKEKGIAAHRGNSAFLYKIESYAKMFGDGKAYKVLIAGDFDESVLGDVKLLPKSLNNLITQMLYNEYGIKNMDEMIAAHKSGKLPDDAYKAVMDEIRDFVGERIQYDGNLQVMNPHVEVLVRADYIVYLNDDMDTFVWAGSKGK